MFWFEITDKKNIQRLVEFEKKVHPSRDWVTVDEYNFWLKRGLKITALINGLNEIIGVYQILDEPDKMFFHGFAVHVKYQSKGIGQKLMDKMIKDYGHKNIACKTRPNNHKMKKLLTRNHFVNRLDEIQNNGEHWTWWTRNAQTDEN